jgi:double-strand break repair protein MRE11
MLDNFLDFILWGHEHECLIHPQQSAVGDFHICQPGAPLVTSLCEAEAKQKFVGVLEVQQNKFRLKEIPLRSNRPFVMDTIELPESGPYDFDPESVEEVSKYVADRIEGLISKAKDLPYGHDMLPLVRLRIDHYGGIALPNLHRLSAMYVGRIANPNEVLLIKRKRSPTAAVPRKLQEDTEMKSLQPEDDGANEPKIGDVINSYIERELLNELFVQDEEDLNSALFDFVDKMDSHSFDKCVQKSVLSAAEVVDQAEVFNPADPDKVQSIREILTVQKKKRRDDRPQVPKEMSLRILKSERVDNDSSPQIIEEEEVNSSQEDAVVEEEIPPSPPSRKRKTAEKESSKRPRAEPDAAPPAKRLRQMKLETTSEPSPPAPSSSSSASSSARTRPSLQLEAVAASRRPNADQTTPSQSQSRIANSIPSNPLMALLTTTSNPTGNRVNAPKPLEVDSQPSNKSGSTNGNPSSSKRVLPQSLAKMRPKIEEDEDVQIVSVPPSQSIFSESSPPPRSTLPPTSSTSNAFHVSEATQSQTQKGDSQFQRSQQWGRRKTKG